MIYDLIGIGAGPSHLSIAALLTKIPDVRSLFFECQANFTWHSGMMIKDAKLQVSFLKDLVTLVDPTSPYSFLNYLHEEKRLYQFITADFKQIHRQEFNQYLQWVSNKLSTIRKGNKIMEVQFKNKLFELRNAAGEQFFAKNLSIGIGQKAYIPAFAQKILGHDVFHSGQYMHVPDDYANKEVLVLGSGQSGAEIFYSLLQAEQSAPSKAYWITRSSIFKTMDDSAFANELFTPQYSQFFYELPFEQRFALLKEQRHTSDGISSYTAQKIFQRLYELKYLSAHKIKTDLRTNHIATAIEPMGNRYKISLHDQLRNCTEQIIVDKIILATGYHFSPPASIQAISHLLQRENHNFIINPDYSIRWHGENSNKIFIVNGAKISHGIADPNLSLLAYRSARIINSLVGKNVYNNIDGHTMIDWPHNTNIQERHNELVT